MSGNRSEPPFRSVPHERMSVGPCVWTQDADDGSWDTSCGEKHCFLDGSPSENNHSFCPYCGGQLQEGEGRPSPALTTHIREQITAESIDLMEWSEDLRIMASPRMTSQDYSKSIKARAFLSSVLTSASDLLDVLDRYPENPVPINRDSATVNQLREALTRAGVK